MAKKNTPTTVADTSDITNLMEVFDDTPIENIDEKISVTEDQLIDREVESVKTTADAGDIDKAKELLSALLKKFSFNQKLSSQKKDIQQHISSKKIDTELKQALDLYDAGEYTKAKKILKQMKGDFSQLQQKLGAECLEKVEKKIEEQEITTANTQLQEAKALYESGKYDKAISLLKTIDPATQQQDELKDEYDTLFNTKKQEAEKQAKEEKIEGLLTNITTSNKAGDIQGSAKSLEELQTLLGPINGQEDIVVDVILETLSTLFQQLGNAIIENDTNTFHNLLEHAGILANHPIISKLKKIDASDTLDPKQTIKQIKTLLDISTPFLGKTRMGSIDDLIVPEGETSTLIVRMIMNTGHEAVSFLEDIWQKCDLQASRKRQISNDKKYIDMMIELPNRGIEYYIDKTGIQTSGLHYTGGAMVGIDELKALLTNKSVISRKSKDGKRRLEIIG